MKAKCTRIIELDDGAVLAFRDGDEFWLTCCDCLLSHHISCSVSKTEARLQLERDERRTAQKRRRFGEKQGKEANAADSHN